MESDVSAAKARVLKLLDFADYDTLAGLEQRLVASTRPAKQPAGADHGRSGRRTIAAAPKSARLPGEAARGQDHEYLHKAALSPSGDRTQEDPLAKYAQQAKILAMASGIDDSLRSSGAAAAFRQGNTSWSSTVCDMAVDVRGASWRRKRAQRRHVQAVPAKLPLLGATSGSTAAADKKAAGSLSARGSDLAVPDVPWSKTLRGAKHKEWLPAGRYHRSDQPTPPDQEAPSWPVEMLMGTGDPPPTPPPTAAGLPPALHSVEPISPGGARSHGAGRPGQDGRRQRRRSSASQSARSDGSQADEKKVCMLARSVAYSQSGGGKQPGILKKRTSLALAEIPEDIDQPVGAISEGEARAREHRRKRSVWTQAFKKLNDDNCLYKEDIPKALEACGHPYPNLVFAEEALQKVTKFVALSLDEFLHLVELYEERRYIAHVEAFQNCDADGSGYVDASELVPMLRSLHIEPMTHVLADIMDEVCQDGRQELDFQAFEKVMKLLTDREGFTKTEYEGYMAGYRLFDREKSGELHSTSFLSLLRWLGFSVTDKEAAGIVDKVDHDKSGSISPREYMVCMRKLRELEIAKVKTVMAMADVNNDGKVYASELRVIVFSALHYTPDNEAVDDAARAAGIDPEDDDLDLSEIWRLLDIYRQREGFSDAEVTEVEEAFAKYDDEGKGLVSSIIIGQLFRVLGLQVDFDILQDIAESVDIEGRKELDLRRLLKVIRLHFAKVMDDAQKVFHQCGDGHGSLKRGCGKAALERMECVPMQGPGVEFLPEGMIQQAQEILNVVLDADNTPRGVRLRAFMTTVYRFKRLQRRSNKYNFGFSVGHVKSLMQRFESYDKDSSGDIDSTEMIVLISKTYPDLAHNAELRPRLKKMVQAVTPKSGKLRFRDFLKLTREAFDLQDLSRLRKLERAVAKTGFTKKDVSGFRELFFGAADTKADQTMTLDEACCMIDKVCPLSEDEDLEFEEIYVKVVGSSEDEIDFPDFLLLMWHLLQTNFARINQRTRVIVKKNGDVLVGFERKPTGIVVVPDNLEP
eukprot:TRINITY_DN46756_c0_g1_i1.p1 TRINITY_DN46756_c0_g1~~TRINITY_DN46756_c0_g1_i1.p1  ORF type:complete len:1034 (-),score=285.33 TRINITY_DN46756_c0_g1_i1:328-3429(-)